MIRTRVIAARQQQTARFNGEQVYCNAQMESRLI
ncbi:MAG: hypothetical protein JNN15_17980 [Blastocatellia bacterium]|nr:hypothetical protein [Blastocatellia bacterium]